MFWFRSLHQRQPILWKTWMHNTRKLKKTLTIQNDTGNNIREIAILWKKKIVKLGVKVFYSPSKVSDPSWSITPLQSSCLPLTWASILVSTKWCFILSFISEDKVWFILFGNKISHISGICTSTAMIDMCEILACAREAKQNYLSTRYYFLSIKALLKTAIYTSVVPLGKT